MNQSWSLYGHQTARDSPRPVASIIRVKGYEEALAEANNTPFGLSAGVATTSLKYATHFKRHSQAGMVMVNLPTAGVDYHVPFGGRGVGEGHGGSIGDIDPVTLPKVLGDNLTLGVLHQRGVDLFQSIYRHGGASHTIGRIVEPWDGAFLKLAQRRRLVDRFATRGTRLSDLP